MNGTVKWFNINKRFGFITPEDGSKDIFVHISSLEKSGLKALNEGQSVSYDVATDKGKTSAVNIKILWFNTLALFCIKFCHSYPSS